MTAFFVGVAILLLVTLVLLARPWWNRSQGDSTSQQALNATIYRNQLAELASDRDAGQLDSADYQEASAEIARRLLDEASPDAAPAANPSVAASSNRQWGVMIAMMIAVPVIAGGMYAWLGSPQAMDKMARRDFSRQEIDAMVANLAAKLEKEPNNYQGWAMLARSYKVMRRFDESEKAFAKAMPVVETEPQLLADYADVLAAKAGGNTSGKPEELLAKALALDPNHMQSLWMLGSAHFNRGEYAQAIEMWQKAVAQLPPDSENAQLLNSIIEEAKQKMGGPVAAKPAAKAAESPTTVSSSATAAKATNDLAEKSQTAGSATAVVAIVQGSIELATELGDKASPGDTVFLIAKAEGGGPMPLAVKRLKLADLPANFQLSDADAMSPDSKLSSARSLVIEARVSKSGEVKKQPGDLFGFAQGVSPNSQDIRITINQVAK